ncbi:Hypothetical protein PBC10988_37480 [Planctomycetales bacterium 10988]|nr:Hypothetical protein PBC10988_37480 [Planctomycetales bacterium 10988]
MEPTTSERIFEQLLERIRSQEWKIGETIPSERILVQELGVSRIVLREALSQLRALGLLETSHGRGSQIQAIDPSLVGQLVPLMVRTSDSSLFSEVAQVRLTLEPTIAEVAALHRTEEDLEKLHQAALQFQEESFLEHQTPEKIRTLDHRFHRCLAESAHHQLFGLFSRILLDLEPIPEENSPRSPKQLRRACEDHFAIVNALESKNAPLAKSLLLTHLLQQQ